MNRTTVPIVSKSSDLWELLQMDTPLKEVEQSGALRKTQWTCWGMLVREVFRLHKDEIMGSSTMFQRLALYIKGACDKQIHLQDPERGYDDWDYDDESSKPYACIPLNVDRFMYLVADAVRAYKGKEKTKFIDAGCGVGDKIVLANMFFDYTYGVELSKFIASCGREINNLGSTQILEGDITTFDFSPYNIVYAYNPIQTEVGMFKFFKNLVKTAKPGTVCMFANVESGDYALRKIRKLKIGSKLVRGTSRHSDHIFVIK